MLIGNHEAMPLVLFVVISVHHEAEWSEYAWSCWAWLFGRWDRLLLGMWQNLFDRSLISVIFLLQIRNRPQSRWNLCSSLILHRSAESEGLRFDSSWKLFASSLWNFLHRMQINLAQHSHTLGTLGTLGTLSVLRLRNRVSIYRKGLQSAILKTQAEGHFVCVCAFKICSARLASFWYSQRSSAGFQLGDRHLFVILFWEGWKSMKSLPLFLTLWIVVEFAGSLDEYILMIKVRTKSEKRPKTWSLRFDLLTIKMCTWDYKPWRLVLRC